MELTKRDRLRGVFVIVTGKGRQHDGVLPEERVPYLISVAESLYHLIFREKYISALMMMNNPMLPSNNDESCCWMITKMNV